MKKKRHFCILKRRCELAQHATRSVCLEIWKATHGNHKEHCRADMPVSQWKGKQLPICIWWSLEWGITVLGSQENMCLPETRCHNLVMPNTDRAQGKGSCNSTRNALRPATYSNWAAKVPSWKDYKRSASRPSLGFEENQVPYSGSAQDGSVDPDIAACYIQVGKGPNWATASFIMSNP